MTVGGTYHTETGTESLRSGCLSGRDHIVVKWMLVKVVNCLVLLIPEGDPTGAGGFHV